MLALLITAADRGQGIKLCHKCFLSLSPHYGCPSEEPLAARMGFTGNVRRNPLIPPLVVSMENSFVVT